VEHFWGTAQLYFFKMASSLRTLLLAASLVPATLAQIIARNDPDPSAENVVLDSLDFSDVGELQPLSLGGGAQYACKCYHGESCWPSQHEWNVLNNTVNGKLRVHIPPGASCYNTFNGPLGTVNTYNAAKCAEATQNWANEQWQ
jgi:hypothetical protein